MKAQGFPVPNSVLRCFQLIRAARSSKSQTPSSREAPSSKFQPLHVKWAGERSGCSQTDERRLMTAALELGIWSLPGTWNLEFPWSLGFGTWCFGLKRSTRNSEEALMHYRRLAKISAD